MGEGPNQTVTRTCLNQAGASWWFDLNWYARAHSRALLGIGGWPPGDSSLTPGASHALLLLTFPSMSSKTFWAKENGVHGLKELTEARLQARLREFYPIFASDSNRSHGSRRRTEARLQARLHEFHPIFCKRFE